MNRATTGHEFYRGNRVVIRIRQLSHTTKINIGYSTAKFCLSQFFFSQTDARLSKLTSLLSKTANDWGCLSAPLALQGRAQDYR